MIDVRASSKCKSGKIKLKSYLCYRGSKRKWAALNFRLMRLLGPNANCVRGIFHKGLLT